MRQERETQRAGIEGEGEEGESLAPGLEGIDPAALVRTAAEFARDNPHAAIGGAFAIGFLLGGGLTPRILTSIALIAGRRYATAAAREALAGIVQREIAAAAEE
jgi:hypothetical protein